jgi:glycosyltransferase involved in cell wall biosynthesis/uncharacterized coiled-coil protein SlyX
MPQNIIFDQYSRYKACSDLLHLAGFVEGNSVLDVGSGPECLFGQFMADARMTYVDPLILSGSGLGRITGNIFDGELDGQSFNCVSAVDVLEHVPPEHRQAFMERMSSLGTNTLILGFPTSDSSDAFETDRAINDQYRAGFGLDYPWLEEHYRFGLPSLTETVEQLNHLGWHCQSVGHGHAPWLRDLLSFVVCAWDIPSLKNLVLEISEKFNSELYSYDFRPPCYRQFVIASRSPLPSINLADSSSKSVDEEKVFRALMEDAYRKYFPVSIRQMAASKDAVAERDAEILQLNGKIQEVSDWATDLNAVLAGRDAEILQLHVKVKEMSDKATDLNAVLAGRDAEILQLHVKVKEMSDKATDLNAVLADRDVEILQLNVKIQDLSESSKLLEEQVQNMPIADLNSNHADQIDSLNQVLAWQDVTSAKLSQKIEDQERALADKHAELMKMSDWAYGMMQELKYRNTALHVKLINKAANVKSTILERLANSILGDMVRYMRNIRRCRSDMVSLDTVRQALAGRDGHLIITFPIIDWDFRWQRPQQIVTRLRDRGNCVLYLAMSLTPLRRRFRSTKEAGTLLGFNELSHHIQQVWLHSACQINIYTDPLEGDDLLNISLGLEFLLQELKPNSIDYLIQFPGWWPVAKKLKELFGGRVVFDCMDDHAGFSTNTAQALETEQDLIRRADLVIVSSAILEDRCRMLNCNISHTKNGTEFEHFADPQKNGLLDHLADRPIIGYYGAISDWFDMEIVAYCAWQRPKWHFVLIGATTGANLDPVAGMSNVHFLGEKPYQALPGYLAYFDVCTIPFKLIPLTLATNPVKFYEYLSAGKPVVSVALPELLPYGDDCYIASDTPDFLVQVEKALAERNDHEKVLRRLQLARENSWDARVEIILASLTRCKPIPAEKTKAA